MAEFSSLIIVIRAGSVTRNHVSLMGIQGMVHPQGWNGETWGATQRISVEEALRVNTINGAYASHEKP